MRPGRERGAMNLNHKYTSIVSLFVVVALVIYQVQAENDHADEIAMLKHSQEEALKLNRDTIASLQATVATLNRQLTAEASRAASPNQAAIANTALASAPASSAL